MKSVTLTNREANVLRLCLRAECEHLASAVRHCEGRTTEGRMTAEEWQGHIAGLRGRHEEMRALLGKLG